MDMFNTGLQGHLREICRILTQNHVTAPCFSGFLCRFVRILEHGLAGLDAVMMNP